MRQLSASTNWLLFGLGVVLLVLIAFTADHTTKVLSDSEQLIAHTLEVKTVLGRVRADVLAAENARLGYVLAKDEPRIEQYERASHELPEWVEKLRGLTGDNPEQQ